MKPSTILLFFLSVFLVLFALALYFPETGIKLPGKLILKFYTADDVFSSRQEPEVNLHAILKKQELLNDSVISFIAGDTTIAALADTLPVDVDSLRKSITRIEYPHGDTALLFSFFELLSELPDSRQLVRIMHYGDSQIEDDRMTSLIRNHLQSKFGGSGVGLIPAAHLYNYGYSITQESSGNLYRYQVYGPDGNRLEHNRYGALAAFCTIGETENKKDTITQTAWIKISKSPYGYENTRHFRQCRIFYGYNTEPFLNELYRNGNLYDAEMFPASSHMRVIRWSFAEPVSNLTIQFRCKNSPEIYGFALDDYYGVAVDNIPLRGCSGMIFSTIDQQLLRDMYKALNVKLFILQFGGNVVPYIAENYRYYERSFYRQILLLKELCPGAAVIVIGVADMSVKDGDRFVTYPNLEAVKAAVKSAAFRGGAAFWDMQAAMGGRNSMPAWVNADPPLASKDYVHFNYRGSQVIAQMFYNAFIYEYLRYEQTGLTTKGTKNTQRNIKE